MDFCTKEGVLMGTVPGDTRKLGACCICQGYGQSQGEEGLSTSAMRRHQKDLWPLYLYPIYTDIYKHRGKSQLSTYNMKLVNSVTYLKSIGKLIYEYCFSPFPHLTKCSSPKSLSSPGSFWVVCQSSRQSIFTCSRIHWDSVMFPS